LAAAGVAVASDVSGALTDRDSTDSDEDIAADLARDVGELAKLAQHHAQKAPGSFQALTELCFAQAPGRLWLNRLAQGQAEMPAWPLAAPAKQAQPRRRTLEAKLETVSCPSTTLRPGASGAEDDPDSVYGVAFDRQRGLLYLANCREVSDQYQTRLSIYSLADLKDLKLLGQAEGPMADLSLHAEIRRDGDELKIFDRYQDPTSYLGFALGAPEAPTFLGSRTDATAERLQQSNLREPRRVLESTTSDLAVVLAHGGAQVVRAQGAGYEARALATLPVHDAVLVKGDSRVAIAYGNLAHRPEIELYELETAQKVARLKQSRVSALFGADTHLWAVCFEEQESGHYAYQLLDINLEPEPVIVRRLALPGLREGSPSDAQSMVRGLFVRDAQALAIWEKEISVFDLPA
jgi:hypothetical protein